jgi:phosphatidylglycerophosphate synthase
MGRTLLPFVPQSVTANGVTLISGTCGICAGVAFYMASFDDTWFVAAALLVLAQWWLDNTDGLVARTRNQMSTAGRFLDIFLDCCTFTAVGIGLAFASYTQFPIIAVATMLCLVQYVVTVLWIALTRIWPFPAFGPAESSLSLIAIALLMTMLPRQIVILGEWPLSLVDVAMGLTIPSSLLAIVISARRLFQHLQQQDRQAA